jgi:predicted PurR-regulated permease PerM
MEQNNQPLPVPWTPRKVALATLTIVAILIAFWILFRFRLVFFSLFTAIVLSTAFLPLINRLTRLGMSRVTSVLVTSLVLLLAVILLLITIAPLLIEQWATLTSLVGGWYQDLRQVLIQSESLVVRRIALRLPWYLPLTLPAPDVEAAVDANPMSFVQQAMDIGSALLRTLLLLVGTALMTVIWILEGERVKRLFLLAISVDRREKTREFLEEIENKVGAYTRGLVLLSSIIGGMALVAYLIIGLPNVLLLAIFAGIMEAVPLVGPTLGAIPAVMVAASTDPSKIIWVVVATIVIQTLENNLVVPRVMDRAVGINPVASLLAFIAFGTIFGFTGALLAIPLAAVIQITLQYYLFQPNPVEQEPPARRDALSALRYEAQNLALDVRKQVRAKEDELDSRTDQFEDALEAVVQDLDSILAQVENSRVDNGNQPVARQP